MTNWMVIIGGPNGAGKSSITSAVLSQFKQQDFIKLNADERTLELGKKFSDKSLPEINLLAAQQTDAEVIKNIEEGKSFYVETVLSSPKYRDDVLAAKARGFKVALIYVSLYPPELSPDRIKLRVKEGGHNVEEAKALDRYERSHKELEWFGEKADTLLIFDNSDKKPILLAAKMAGRELTHHKKGVNPRIDCVIRKLNISKLSGNNIS